MTLEGTSATKPGQAVSAERILVSIAALSSLNQVWRDDTTTFIQTLIHLQACDWVDTLDEVIAGV